MSSWDLRAAVRGRIDEEEGTLYKAAPLRVALCYPAPYHVGMSSLGFQAIYREIHRHPEWSAERAFLPERVEEYRRAGSPVFSYETETPLWEFPVAAFSIAWELEIPGFFSMLDLSGIPALRADREEHHPLIVVGGPLTYSNPSPLAPFADLMILGEGEELIRRFLDAAAAEKRHELLEQLASAPGFYAPGRSRAYPAIAKAPDDRLPARSQILTRHAVLRSMFLVEPERGCSRGCTYCTMRRTTNGGMRLVPPARIIELIPDNARRVGLVGAAVTDHPRIKEIVRRIVESGREVGISSLRADRLDGEFVGLLARGGYRTLTTASDGASQRLRDRIDRKTSEEHLVGAARLAREHGLEKLKLYEMIGLPGEGDADIDELVRFSLELARLVPVTLGISPFVAKRHTPMDGAPFEAVAVLEARLRRLRAGVRGRVGIRPTSARWSWVEYMLSQSGEDAGLAALDAWKNGGSFASWQQAFRERGVKPYLLQRAADGRRSAPSFPVAAPP